jgi:hypothetical protein
MGSVIAGTATTSGLMSGRNLDYEKDSLHIMPLVGLPVQTKGLKQSRMIKNLHFDSMVEVFKDDESGSGQIMPSKLGNLFEWPAGQKHPDGVLVARMGLLQSFDVYSLRIHLRSLGIEVEDISHLRLSDSKRRELDRYMRQFTRPLMDIICEETGITGLTSTADMVALFNGQVGEHALQNLKNLSRKLKIILSKLPDFLTDYGDVFLSLAYFKDQYDNVRPRVERFLLRMEKARQDSVVSRDAKNKELFEKVPHGLTLVMAHIEKRMGYFDRHTESMWDNLDVNTFEKVKMLIEGNHSTIGGLLCGLHIQMEGYENAFRKVEPSNQALMDYVATYIDPVVQRLMHIQRSSRYVEAR